MLFADLPSVVSLKSDVHLLCIYIHRSIHMCFHTLRKYCGMFACSKTLYNKLQYANGRQHSDRSGTLTEFRVTKGTKRICASSLLFVQHILECCTLRFEVCFPSSCHFTLYVLYDLYFTPFIWQLWSQVTFLSEIFGYRTYEEVYTSTAELSGWLIDSLFRFNKCDNLLFYLLIPVSICMCFLLNIVGQKTNTVNTLASG